MTRDEWRGLCDTARGTWPTFRLLPDATHSLVASWSFDDTVDALIILGGERDTPPSIADIRRLVAQAIRTRTRATDPDYGITLREWLDADCPVNNYDSTPPAEGGQRLTNGPDAHHLYRDSHDEPMFPINPKRAAAILLGQGISPEQAEPVNLADHRRQASELRGETPA